MAAAAGAAEQPVEEEAVAQAQAVPAARAAVPVGQPAAEAEPPVAAGAVQTVARPVEPGPRVLGAWGPPVVARRPRALPPALARHAHIWRSGPCDPQAEKPP